MAGVALADDAMRAAARAELAELFGEVALFFIVMFGGLFVAGIIMGALHAILSKIGNWLNLN